MPSTRRWNRDRVTRQQESELTELRHRYGLLTAREREVMALVVTGMPQQANRIRPRDQHHHREDTPGPCDAKDCRRNRWRSW